MVPGGEPFGGAMITGIWEPPGGAGTGNCSVPAALYSVVRPVPLSDTQNGLIELNEMPQGFDQTLVLSHRRGEPESL